MTRLIKTLQQALDEFDVAVLDQWGVLHDGSQPYPQAASALKMLAANGKTILVVSNSGKRADLNLARISKLGLPTESISKVVTSGEALWEDLVERRLQIANRVPENFYPICGAPGDADAWAEGGRRIRLSDRLDQTVDAILLMGLADGTSPDAYDQLFHSAIKLGKPLVCSNPDKTSPRPGGLVISPGALADRFVAMGGHVVWYGKPNANVYRAVQRRCPDIPARRFLMIGDSVEHDIAGAQQVGFQSALIRGGIHAGDFADAIDDDEISRTCERLVAQCRIRLPDFSLSLFA